MAQPPLTYLDNAATTWPKPPGVAEAMVKALAESGNPGRAGHRLANAAARTVYEAREAVAEVFHAADPLRVVFGPNVTWALNLVMRGLLKPGDHVVTTSVEHNSVMRPLRALEGVRVDTVQCGLDGCVKAEGIIGLLHDTTALIVMTHASNVTGALLPVREVGAEARRRGIPLLVDAAQTAGAVPTDMAADNIDFLALTGHKSLCGPMGTGGVVFGPGIDPARLAPLERGGTGSHSDREQQPDFLPDCFESGTPNVVGLAGLAAGVRWVMREGVAHIRGRECSLTRRLLGGLAGVPGVQVYGPGPDGERTGTVSFTASGLSPSEIALRLDGDHGVLCRAGLHCSPACHRTIGTFPTGTVRFSIGPLSTEADVDRGLEALSAVVRERTR
jgi:cysteine desulfurase/selenocysteine lyase